MNDFDPEMARRLAREDGDWASAYPELQMGQHRDLYFMLGVLTAKLQMDGIPTQALLAYIGHALRQGERLRRSRGDEESESYGETW